MWDVPILGGSCDLVSKVISTIIGVISIVPLIITLVSTYIQRAQYPLKYIGLHIKI